MILAFLFLRGFYFLAFLSCNILCLVFVSKLEWPPEINVLGLLKETTFSLVYFLYCNLIFLLLLISALIFIIHFILFFSDFLCFSLSNFLRWILILFLFSLCSFPIYTFKTRHFLLSMG